MQDRLNDNFDKILLVQELGISGWCRIAGCGAVQKMFNLMSKIYYKICHYHNQKPPGQPLCGVSCKGPRNGSTVSHSKFCVFEEWIFV